MKVRLIFPALAVVFLTLLPPAWAVDNVLITEFMAANSGTLLDEDGDSSDWIELHNAGTNVVNLVNWSLTDSQSQLTEWRFPSTNLLPNAYLIVFASGKDRRVPGAPLHTNFKLNNSGEYLALVAPDGTNVVSAYAPRFPVQVAGVSYGIPVTQTTTTLIASGATARVLVPQNDALGLDWAGAAFDDSAWLNAAAGVGFDADSQGAFMPVTIANSQSEFSGTQGLNNWFYGYWDKKNDANGVYSDSEFVPFPNEAGGFSANNYFNAATGIWDWFNGNPPNTELSSDGGRPTGNSGNPALAVHWAVRRYSNEYNGPITIRGRITHTSDWVYVTATGNASSSLLYIYQTGVGEGYIDDIKLVAGSVPEAGANLVVNGDFESGAVAPWTVSPNLVNSSISTTVIHSGSRSLHIVSTAAGTTQGSSIWQSFTPTLTTGQPYTLSYWYLPGTNSSPLVLRMSGSWINTTPAYCGDGTIARIFIDGAQVFQQTAFLNTVDYTVTAPARLGSKVDFVIDPGPANNDLCDGTTFTANIATANAVTTVVADSAADWSFTGKQGEKNWYYGYYNKSADPDRIYQATDFTAYPHAPGPQGPNNFWDEEDWDWFNGKPPFDKIGQYWMMPNGTNNGAEHWVIRRWVSEVTGTITVEWAAFKEFPDQNHLGGGGVTLHIFHNGIQRDGATVAGGDVTGVHRSATINNVQVGDTIDIALDPTNLDGRPDDDTDRTFVTAVIRGTPSLNSLIASSLEPSMRDINATAYLRFPFTVADPSAFSSLLLQMKYDDGFVAYLNGVEVARANAPLLVTWNSAAPESRSDAANNEWEEYNLSTSLGLLRSGANVLAIQGLNASASDLDFLILPELTATTVTYDLSARRYFMLPTPGEANGYGNTNLGPLIVSASHSPSVPTDNDDLAVTASVASTFNAVSSVRLIYRVMYSNEVNIPMFDDGLHGDGAAGDGVWGASIPASASNPGQMVRYYIFATDTRTNGSRFPAYEDPQNSPQYQGTVVFNPTLTNPLPVLHFFVQNSVLASNYTGTRCSVFWNDEFFDNVGVNAHGQTTWSVFPKRSLDFNLNTGYKLRWKRGEARVKAFDLITTSSDKAHMRTVMAFETFRDSGVPTHYAFPVRVQQNNAFFGVMHFVEQANDDFLERNGLNPNGALYKMYFPLTNAYAGAKKVTRKNEPNNDLQALIDGLNPTNSQRRQFLFDNVDVAEVVNMLATIEVVENEDCCYYKNYYLYRDTDRTGEWQMLPWDLDLTFGRSFVCLNPPNFCWVYVGGILYGGYYDTNIYPMNLYYSEARASRDFIGAFHPIFEALWASPDTQNMFLRRWSSVQEQFLQQTNTHPLLLKFERRVDELTAQIGPDAALDFALWRPYNPPSFLLDQTLPQAVSLLKTGYFTPRRPWIFNTLRFANGGPYLGTQPTNATIVFGDIDFNPSSGNQSQEYIQLRNTNNYSIDLSGWKLTGAVEFTFKGGTVIASNGALYVSPDVTAFRARTTGPGGGQGLFVQGSYKGQLSARGESLQLVDKTGRLVHSTNYLGNPSLPQQYLRITEIMYSPAPPPPGLATNAEEFEFIELKNTGPVSLNLVGVHFANGIEFNFTGSSVTNLAPGQTALVVRNLAAFVSRYGSGFNIAGQYTGQLDNNGENIRLEDATGEKILDFNYSPDWYPITGGIGFSLEIADEHAAWDTWGLASSWRVSRGTGGSPGQTYSPPPPIPAIVVNEVLTHTDPPLIDAIELYNPTPFLVNLGGWYISDDFKTPKKYRINGRTLIPAGGFLVLNETQFNPTNPPSPTGFAFSSKGDEAYLFSADEEEGTLTGYYHGFAFGAAENGVSFGRYINSVGEEQFVAQSVPTLGATNAGPKVGPIVISEIAYRPADYFGGLDNSDDEFIELRNITGAAVPLFDLHALTNTWRLRGVVDYDFPLNVSLATGGFLLLVNFDPANAAQLASFRSKYGLGVEVPIFGPYDGKLDNSAGHLKLSKPDAPEAGEVPYILVDEVDYKDSAPWPGLADGTGATLQRRVAGQYGNDPINWTAAAPTVGRLYVNGAAPIIVTQPNDVTALATGDATFSITASGAMPLRYQWRFNGDNVSGGTNAVLLLTNVQLSQAGPYSVTVFNDAGSVESSNATLTLLLGAYFVTQPQSTNIVAGGNFTNTAQAVSSTPIAYQWKFNGTNLPGATSNTLVITNVQFEHGGVYVLVANDGSGPVSSRPATVTVVVPPIIAQSPISQTIVSGATVVLSVTVTNNASLPIGFRWRRNGNFIPDAFYILSQRSSFYVITNASLPYTNYNVVVTNAASPGGRLSGTATLSFLADSDGDGIPDQWEIDHGLNQFDPTDRDLDSDGDGRSNWEEYISGTDPLDPSSYFKINGLTLGGGASLSFLAVSNKTYTVFYTDSLPASPLGVPWNKLVDVPARATNRAETIVDPDFKSKRYYRLATPRQP